MRVEAKLHGITKIQNNDWIIKLVMSTEDYLKWGVGADPMGTRYNLDISDAAQEEENAVYTDPTIEKQPSKIEKTEGEKLLAIAHIRCKEVQFQRYATKDGINFKGAYSRVASQEELAAEYIYETCDIDSRKELVTDVHAQDVFRDLDRKYKEWCKPPIEEQYADNLEMMP